MRSLKKIDFFVIHSCIKFPWFMQMHEIEMSGIIIFIVNFENWSSFSSYDFYYSPVVKYQTSVSTFVTFSKYFFKEKMINSVERTWFFFSLASFCRSSCQRPATLLKKRPWHRCFPVNFAKIPKSIFSHKAPPVAASDRWHKVTNIASIDIILMSLLHYLDTFWCTLPKGSEILAQRSSIKKLL